MIYLDPSPELLGVDEVACTYWPTGHIITAVDPAHSSRVLHLNDEQKFVFLDDALPLELCFQTDAKIVAQINWARIMAGLPATKWSFKHINVLTPIPDSPIQ